MHHARCASLCSAAEWLLQWGLRYGGALMTSARFTHSPSGSLLGLLLALGIGDPHVVSHHCFWNCDMLC